MNAKQQVIVHRDGTITYWSVYIQQWVHKASIHSVPDRELAAMPAPERARVLRAQATHNPQEQEPCE